MGEAVRLDFNQMFASAPTAYRTAMLAGYHFGRYEAHRDQAKNGVFPRATLVGYIKQAAKDLHEVGDEFDAFASVLHIRQQHEVNLFNEWTALVQNYIQKYDESKQSISVEPIR